ncbi:DUF3889 domain-containing protein [Alicyclobacillus fodiniaquatilis]|jgi:hypothetical protein|uniref:DUF3889 domain-containing protein n=1 Tax=Alicyclobacillus fodiniaquatilis TaxID=1661150 RepID=A0ABW4JGI1_9BACL
MKIWLSLLVVCISTVCIFNKTTALAFTNGVSNTAKPTPSYAKWGSLAVQEAKKRYPDSTVIDYKHVGLKEISSTESQETFKLWMRNSKHEFGLYVYVVYNKANQKLSRISFKETSR